MADGYVYTRTLTNGMDVLLAPDHTIPKVSIQLWYNVGSKDETRGRKGIAHLIEHMIFKGTETLSEADINAIVYKLSGTTNAFTSHDYTGYLFDMPAQNWHHVLPIMADCMRNCSFKQEHLNSELRTIIQEIKLYNDDYMSSLLEGMLGMIFHDHPYRDPVIGYKQDLLALSQDDICQFYQYHYVPNNAALVVLVILMLSRQHVLSKSNLMLLNHIRYMKRCRRTINMILPHAALPYIVMCNSRWLLLLGKSLVHEMSLIMFLIFSLGS